MMTLGRRKALGIAILAAVPVVLGLQLWLLRAPPAEGLRPVPALQADLGAFKGALSAEALQQLLSGTTLDCGTGPGRLIPGADYGCYGDISAFLGVRASSATFQFRKERLLSMRIGYAPGDHGAMVARLEARYGPARAATTGEGAVPVLAWTLPEGVARVRSTVSEGQPAVLLWVSREADAAGLEPGAP